MTRKEQIQRAYKLTGSNASFYDGMMTYSAFPGKAICRIVRNMDGEKDLRDLEKALAGIPEDFSGKLLELPVGTGVLTMPGKRFFRLAVSYSEPIRKRKGNRPFQTHDAAAECRRRTAHLTAPHSGEETSDQNKIAPALQKQSRGVFCGFQPLSTGVTRQGVTASSPCSAQEICAHAPEIRSCAPSAMQRPSPPFP